MTLALLVFYLLAAVAVAVAGVMVISARNPVHSVLFLILAFFNAAGLFVLIGAEFLAMVLVVVYVGAVAVLFLFVVMMLDINFVRLREGFLQYLPVGGLIGLILLVELCWSSGLGAHARAGADGRRTAGAVDPDQHRGAGRPVLHRLLLPFQAAGMILLVAMIGAITLTLPPGRGAARASPSRCTAGARKRWSCARSSPGAASDGGAARPLPPVAAILFTLGIFGIFLNRKNVIILMSIELMLLAVNLNFVAFSAYLGDLAGQVFAMFVLTVAAAEAAIGLAILVVYFRNRGSIEVEDINLMRG